MASFFICLNFLFHFRVFQMQNILSAFAVFSVVLLGPSLSVAQSNSPETLGQILKTEQQEIGSEVFTAPGYKPGTVQHIVLFKYRKSVTPAQIEEVRNRFLALKTVAKRNGKPYILRLEAGAQNSGEGADHGFQEGFVVTFRSQGDRNYYVGTPIVTDPKFFDPAHQKFKDFVGPLLAEKDGALVFDFKAQTQ